VPVRARRGKRHLPLHPLQSGDAFDPLLGLDLYRSQASIEAMLGYLDRVDPEAATGRNWAGHPVQRG
jgi:erythromycin esterase-like protein